MNKGMLKMPYIFKMLTYIHKNKDTTMVQLFETKITPAHLVNMKKFADSKGLLDIKKDGKKQIINLNEKGTKVIKLFNEMMFELGELNVDSN